MTKDQDDELVHEFLVESHENLARLDRELVDLERDPANAETLASVFRTIHTIKGTCGFLGFSKLEAVAHRGESLLSKLRDGVLALSPEITSALLALVDAVRQILEHIEHAGGEGDVDYAFLLDRLSALEQAEPVASAAPASLEPAPVPAAAPEGRGPGALDASIRVDLCVLDRLMNLVGELVLTRNQILQRLRTDDVAGLTRTCQHLDLLTGELQEGILRTRMQPIANAWSRLPRLVRDVAVACGKQVRIEMQGEHTELDRALIETIKDPLTHIVRNAVDHGIESPAVRTAAGKPAEGHLFLGAFHEGGLVNVEIADDGAGIDPERIRAKALARGLLTEEQAGRLSESELLGLVFLPGFSTAERVTNVSGRGVGMDVVKRNIERLGGAVDVWSRPGQGTRFRMKIPLTLAIIPALIVASGGDRYALPQSSLVELVRLEGEAARRGVERIHEAAVHRLRGRLLPLVDLARTLDVADAPDAGQAGATVHIVVLRAGEQLFGLVVDAVHDTEEIVVKPLAAQISHLASFSGATLLGDGSVALILDVLGLARQARVVSGAAEGRWTETAPVVAPAAAASQRWVLVRTQNDRRLAIPLSRVARLEEISRAAVEMAGDRPVLQCRGRILPLIDVGGALRALAVGAAGDCVQVVVCGSGAHQTGLVVDRVLDVVEERLEISATGAGKGVLGSAVIGGRVTEILDLDALGVDPGAHATGEEASP